MEKHYSDDVSLLNEFYISRLVIAFTRKYSGLKKKKLLSHEGE